nr:hypothetical protein [Sphingobium xenophagum]
MRDECLIHIAGACPVRARCLAAQLQ